MCFIRLKRLCVMWCVFSAGGSVIMKCQMKRKALALNLRGYHVRAKKSTFVSNNVKLRMYCELDSCICLVSYLTWPSPVPIHLPLLPSTCTTLLLLYLCPIYSRPIPEIILFLSYLQFKACWLNYLRTVREKGNNCRQPSVSRRETLLRQLLG